jgi:predicted nucleotidyltransferase
LEAELRRRGVTGVSPYGSFARGEATAASDVDLLLSVAPGARFSLLEMSDVRLLVADRLGRGAAVVGGRGPHPRVPGAHRRRSRPGLLMARASVADRLRHVLAGVALVRSFTLGRTAHDYTRDPMLRRTVERSIA